MLSIVPEPKRVALTSRSFALWRRKSVHVGRENADDGALLAEQLSTITGVDLPVVQHEDWRNCFAICDTGRLSQLEATWPELEPVALTRAPGEARPADSPASATEFTATTQPAALGGTTPATRVGAGGAAEMLERYALSIAENAVLVRAGHADGLYWGMQTLIQLAQDSPTLPCLRIDDWPDLEVRGVHLDLKGGTPTLPYLLSVLDHLSLLKINTVMVEYEDKVRYDRHPAIASAAAFSKQDIRRFCEHARRRHIRVMPLLQCLGHVEYILKLPEYSEYRESDDHVQQWCPSKPETFELFTDLADELMDLHPQSPYFHIGGDEARQIGECPRCRSRVTEVGKHRFYLEYITRVCKYVISRGRIPVLWDDMITRHEPALMDELPEEALLMYWNYAITTTERSFLSANGGWAYSREWTKKQYDGVQGLPVTGVGKRRVLIEELPAEAQALYRRHSTGTDYPRMIKTTLFMDIIAERGRRFLGAPGAQPGSHKVLSNPEESYPNIHLFARSTVENGGMGIVATGWTRNGSLREPNGIIPGMWPGFYATAEYGWSSDGVDARELDRKLNRRLFGIDGWAATDAVWLVRHLSHVPSGEDLHEWFLALANEAERNGELLRYYAVMADLFLVENEIGTFIGKTERYYYALKHGNLTERERRHYRRELAHVRRTMDRAEKEMRDAYAQYLKPSQVEDCVDSFFDWRRKHLAFHESMVAE